MYNHLQQKEDSRLALVTEEWSTKAKAYARIRQLATCKAEEGKAPDGNLSESKLRAFERCLGLSHESADLRVLAFWATGISKTLRAIQIQQHTMA